MCRIVCNLKSIILLLISFIFTTSVNSQDVSKYAGPPQKGRLYFYWGWNRGFFSNSDIHLKGSNYDFTLYNVVAKDVQTPFNIDDYFNPFKVTIPQTNFRVGYYFNEHYDLSFGIDHMKYVMQQNQVVNISGYINQSGTEYDGVYNNSLIKLKTNFLKYEHTNGLTYVNLELRRSDKILELGKLVHFNLDLNLTEGVGAGFLYPRTDATLLGYNRINEFHVAGYGTAAMVGLRLSFLKYFFFQSEFKVGYINLPDVIITSASSDRANQHFSFIQTNVLIGASISLVGKK